MHEPHEPTTQLQQLSAHRQSCFNPVLTVPIWMILKQILDIIINISFCLYKTRETKRKNQNQNTIITLKSICNFKPLFFFLIKTLFKQAKARGQQAACPQGQSLCWKLIWAFRLRTSQPPRLRVRWGHGLNLGKGLGDRDKEGACESRAFLL